MRVEYTDRTKNDPYYPGVNAKWFEGYTLQEVIKMITGDIEPDHNHSNLSVLDLFGVTADGKLTFKGKEIIVSGGSDGSEGSTILATQVIETADRKFVSGSEKRNLSGLKSNVQSQLDILAFLTERSMKFVGRYDTHEKMLQQNPNPNYGDTAFVDNDETQNNASTVYYFQTDKWLRIKKDKSSNGWLASTSAPADKTVLWLDIASMPPVIKWYSGSKWVDISSAIEEIKASKVIQETDLKFVTDKMIEILSLLRMESGDLLFDGNILGGAGTSLIDDIEPSYTKVFSSKYTDDKLKEKQDALSYVPENVTKKGMPNGYVPLDSNTIIPLQYLDESIKQFSFVVDLESDKTALDTMIVGDTCYVKSTSKEYIYLEEWTLKTDTYKINRIPLNKLDAKKSPTEIDDTTAGYTEGSIWINRTLGHGFICVDSTEGAAVWDLMGGQISIATGEIIPFKYEENSAGRVDNQKRFLIPNCDLTSAYVEIAVDGKEKELDKDYTIATENDLNYIDFTVGIGINQVIIGEIYLMGHVGDQSDIMRKMVYDTDNDGIVDRAEISNAVHNLRIWTPNTHYLKDSLILKDGVIIRAKDSFLTGQIFDAADWLDVFAKPLDLNHFTTDDLKESSSKKYVSPEQLTDIELIKSIHSSVTNHESQISTNRRDIDINRRDILGLNSKTDATNNRINELTLLKLKDTPSSYTANSVLEINKTGDRVVFNPSPMYPIKEVIDSEGKSYKQIEKLKLDKFVAKSFIDSTRQLELTPNLLTTDLFDMPENHEHGKILISNGYNSKYELINTDELTASKENFNLDIHPDAWIVLDSGYYYDIVHNLDSTHLILSFVDANKNSLNTIHTLTYKIIDNNTVRIFSATTDFVTCTINASLGVKNGYWEFMFDLSKLEFVDDTKTRRDKSYSSHKLNNIFDLHAKKDNVYSIAVSDSKFAKKELEHPHSNLTCLDKLTEDNDGNIYYDGKKLIYEIIPYTYSETQSVTATDQELVFDIYEIYKTNKLQAIINSELLISTQGLDAEARIVIYDERFKVLDENIAADNIQKYVIGISNKIKIYVTGKADLKLTVASI